MSILCEKKGEMKKQTSEEETTDFEFVSGLRRGGQLLYMLEEKQLYVYKVAWNEKRNFNRRVKKYTCYEKGCKASVVYVEDDDVCRKNKKPHTHEHTQEERRKNFDFINACKTAAANALEGQSLHDIYNNTLNNNLVDKPTLSYEKLKRTLYRLRKDSSTPSKIPKRSTEEFQHVTIDDNLGQAPQSSASAMRKFQNDTLRDTLVLKTEENSNKSFKYDTLMEQTYDMPSPENLRQSFSDMEDDDLADICEPMFEENALEDKKQMETILENILNVQKKRLSIDQKRMKIEERRLAIEEKRLAIEEKRLILEGKYVNRNENILNVQKRRLLIGHKRMEIEAKRLVIEEKRLAVEEEKLLLEGKYFNRNTN